MYVCVLVLVVLGITAISAFFFACMQCVSGCVCVSCCDLVRLPCAANGGTSDSVLGQPK